MSEFINKLVDLADGEKWELITVNDLGTEAELHVWGISQEKINSIQWIVNDWISSIFRITVIDKGNKL